LDIFKDWVDDNNIELSNTRYMTTDRGYIISYVYISFGMIAPGEVDLDLIRNYGEYESLGYNCEVEYFYQNGNSPSAKMVVCHNKYNRDL